MNKTFAYIVYYSSVIIISILLTEMFRATTFQSILIGLGIGMFANVYIAPVIDLYCKE